MCLEVIKQGGVGVSGVVYVWRVEMTARLAWPSRTVKTQAAVAPPR